MNFEELAEEYQNAKPKISIKAFYDDFPQFFDDYGIEIISICGKTFFKGRNYWKQLTDNLFTLSATRSNHIIHKYLPPERNEDGREKARFISIYPDIPVTRKIIIKKVFGLGLCHKISNTDNFNENYLIEFEAAIDDEDNISIYPNITKEKAAKDEILFKVFSYFNRLLSYDKFNLNLDNVKSIFNDDYLFGNSEEFTIKFRDFDSSIVNKICCALLVDLAVIPSKEEPKESVVFVPRDYFWKPENFNNLSLNLPSFIVRKNHFNNYISLSLKGINYSPSLIIEFTKYKYDKHSLTCKIIDNNRSSNTKMINDFKSLIRNSIHDLNDFYGLLVCDIKTTLK